ncbi:hypothetical protein GGP41_006813 [Bipolaris sorokiniana]|uniref:Uncharacterized protein n=1 Tax=Cochliobolus sativus TaxID=45130 RepID=A0A8H6E099_COCSA|nr:hypothetical protein GGP41_006813 [Bipolaris sorokiniana]
MPRRAYGTYYTTTCWDSAGGVAADSLLRLAFSASLPRPPGLPWREGTTHPGPPTPPGPGAALPLWDFQNMSP